MKQLCAKFSVDFHRETTFGSITSHNHYTWQFISLDIVGKDIPELRYKLRKIWDYTSPDLGKVFTGNDRGTTVWQVSLRDLDENKVTSSKALNYLSDKTEPKSGYAHVFVLSDDRTNKVKVKYEDVQFIGSVSVPVG